MILQRCTKSLDRSGKHTVSCPELWNQEPKVRGGRFKRNLRGNCFFTQGGGCMGQAAGGGS